MCKEVSPVDLHKSTLAGQLKVTFLLITHSPSSSMGLLHSGSLKYATIGLKANVAGVSSSGSESASLPLSTSSSKGSFATLLAPGKEERQ